MSTMSSHTPLRSSPRLRTRTSTVIDPLVTPLKAKSSSSSQDPPKPKRRRIVTPIASPDKQVSRPQVQRSSSVPATPTRRIPDEEFLDLQVPSEELRPSATLTTGQCFHWKTITEDKDNSKQSTSAWGTHNATEWLGTLRVSKTGQSIVVTIRETPVTTLYRVLHAPPELDVHQFLWDYFQLDESLVELYDHWSQRDERLKKIAKCIRGVRIINQDPWECLASFICSSNNNIPRITKILASIRTEYGNVLIPKGEHGMEEPIYSFPSLQELKQKATDKDLREKCGIGYRAKYILETMALLDSLGGESYLEKLKEGSTTAQEVQEEMIQFSGVGRKVADCVSLFSLRQSDAIPVDVHVWNIACRDYDPEGKLRSVKSLTPTVYRQVEEIFRSKFQNNAGWAQSLLFVAELPSFRAVLTEELLTEMDKFRAEEKARKKAKK